MGKVTGVMGSEKGQRGKPGGRGGGRRREERRCLWRLSSSARLIREEMRSWRGDPDSASPGLLKGGGDLLWALPLALGCCPRDFAFHLKEEKKIIKKKSMKG